MMKAFKVFNNVLRVLFIGFTAVFALAKIFNVDSKKNNGNIENTEHITSEFDEIW